MPFSNNVIAEPESCEELELRIVNVSNSSMAYLGFMAGYTYVHELVADGDFNRFLRQLMLAEIATTQTVEGFDIEVYSESLLRRFANAELRLELSEIAANGSQGLADGLLDILRVRLAEGRSIDHLCLVIAGWLRYAMAYDEAANAIDIQDPLAERFTSIERASYDAQENMHDIDALVKGFLGITEIFGRYLETHVYFNSKLRYWLAQVLANGVQTTLKIFLLK